MQTQSIISHESFHLLKTTRKGGSLSSLQALNNGENKEFTHSEKQDMNISDSPDRFLVAKMYRCGCLENQGWGMWPGTQLPWNQREKGGGFFPALLSQGYIHRTLFQFTSLDLVSGGVLGVLACCFFLNLTLFILVETLQQSGNSICFIVKHTNAEPQSILHLGQLVEPIMVTMFSFLSWKKLDCLKEWRLHTKQPIHRK